MTRLMSIVVASLALTAGAAIAVPTVVYAEESHDAVAVTPSLLSGVVKDARGKPLNGVMVRVSEETSGLADNVFTDANGKYALSTRLSGDVVVRFRLPYYQDETRKLTLAAGQPVAQAATLKRMTAVADISESLPSGYHFGNLAFDKDPTAIFSRRNVQRDCAGCHALGNAVSRAPRPLDQWVEVVKRMQGYLGNPDPKLIESRAALLSAGFRGQAPKVRPVFPINAELHTAVIHEYKLENILYPHDGGG